MSDTWDMVFDDERLASPASVSEGHMTSSEETLCRAEGIGHMLEMVQQAAKGKLVLPFGAAATASVFYHRFYVEQSFSDYPSQFGAVAALLLALKITQTQKCSTNARSILVHSFAVLSDGGAAPTTASSDFQAALAALQRTEKAILASMGGHLCNETAYDCLLFIFPSYPILFKRCCQIIATTLSSTLCLKYPAQLYAAGVVKYALSIHPQEIEADAAAQFTAQEWFAPLNVGVPPENAGYITPARIAEVADGIQYHIQCLGEMSHGDCHTSSMR
eukprot:m.47782 g.47782  ORF g.47782 m.47782 type:complete len:275 (-) comp11000_c0_seq2:1272-2096(-)